MAARQRSLPLAVALLATAHEPVPLFRVPADSGRDRLVWRCEQPFDAAGCVQGVRVTAIARRDRRRSTRSGRRNRPTKLPESCRSTLALSRPLQQKGWASQSLRLRRHVEIDLNEPPITKRHRDHVQNSVG